MFPKEFKGTKWKKQIDVSDFILKNYTAYNGDESFLKPATLRTKNLYKKVQALFNEEQKRGGILDVNAEVVCSILSYKPGFIDKEKELIIGLQTEEPLKRGVNLFGGKRMVEQALKEYGFKLSEKLKENFKFRTTHNDGIFRVYTDDMKKARHVGLLTGLPDSYGRGRLIGDYRRVALYGMDYLIEQKKLDKKMLGEGLMTDDNIRLIEEVYKQLEFMEQLKTMAEQYGFDISKPAQNAKEAIQWLYFGYLGSIKEQNGAANSIGRISTFLDIYLQRDIEMGVLNEQQAQELIDDLIIKFRMVRHLRTAEYNVMFAGDPTWVTLSEAGVTKNGLHMVTKTSYRILNSLYNLGPCSEPNITILWSSQLPENYKKFCAKVSIETNSIQYENDDLMRVDYGDDYSIACCVSAIKTGKQMQYFGARCNLPKVLLLSLNGGKDEIYGEQVAPIGNSFNEGLLDYNKVIKAYKKYSKWVAGLYVNTLNAIHYMHDKLAYERLTMALHDTFVERLMAFGISGLSVLTDSLSAIKYAKVYAKKDKRGIVCDFKTVGNYPKYGNDDDRADDIAKEIVKDFYKNLKSVKTYRNAKHTLSILTITSNVAYGAKTGTTPDGRKLGEPFAPGANPMHGRDCSGAVASLNSVAKLDYNYCKDGISNTFTVVPKTLGKNTKDQSAMLVKLLSGYFSKNAHHLNVNVLNKETLIDAMNNPQNYPNLTIRVSGYAVNFNKLTKAQQQEVINRTFHKKF